MTTLTVPVLGPILGGSICDVGWGWPFIFMINAAGPHLRADHAKLLKRYETHKVKMPIDVIGLALLVLFAGSRCSWCSTSARSMAGLESSLIIGLAVTALPASPPS